MATQAQFDEVLSRIDTAITQITQNQGLSASAEDAVLAKLEDSATKLEDVANGTTEQSS